MQTKIDDHEAILSLLTIPILSTSPTQWLSVILPAMPRRRTDPENMTAEEELRSLLKWAEQLQLENVARALCRILAKMGTRPKAQKRPRRASLSTK
jgi:hypothetical protein